MQLAHLDTVIRIQQNHPFFDETNQPIDNWQDTVTCYAQRLSRPGREFFQASRTVAESRVFFVIRHHDGIESSMRVVDGEKVYDIIGVMYSEKRKESMQLECKEVI